MSWKSSKCYIFWVCVCRRTFHHAKPMPYIILSFVACPALPHFSTMSRKWHEFRGNKFIENEMCFFFSLQRVTETFLILRIIKRHVIISICRYSCKVPVIIVRCYLSNEVQSVEQWQYHILCFVSISNRGADPCIVFNRLVTEARYLNALLTHTAVVFAISFMLQIQRLFL